MRLLPFLPLLAASVLSAQQPATATLVGTVYDSLRLRPMVGARVRLDSTDNVAIVDSDGRFRLENITPGSHFVRVEHPVLDTAAIGIRSASLNYAAGDTKAAELATPSGEALVDRMCAAAWRARGPAALMGRVREADTGKPAIGAKVSFLWYELAAGKGLRKEPRVREATVGADGTYRICGLPAQLEGKAQVIRGNMTSGEIVIQFGEDMLALRSMSIAAPGAVVAVAQPGDSAPPVARNLGTAQLTGRVLDRANKPIAGARVQLDGTTRVAETRANGSFVLDSLPAGTQTVTVRKLGYSPQDAAVDLSSLAPTSVTVSMPDYVPVLETVRVSAARDRALDDVGFARRKRTGTGWYMDGTELTNRPTLMFSDVLRSAPGIQINRTGNKQFITNSRDPVNGCVQIYIDGTEWQQMEPGDIDDFVKPYEVGAIEVYTPTTVPAEFAGKSNRGNCSAVIVWTIRRLDRRK